MIDFCIVSKVEYTGGKVTYTPVNFIQNNEPLCMAINNDYDNTLGAWVETNKDDLESGAKQVSEFFDTTPYVHFAKETSSTSNNLTELTDINDL
jgi:hypothetical protein